ncbi:hypothetical protein [Lentzea cavernae]|uniref:Transmembrane protein n=1 Tax=Lentzea cavernae TaxID=2020703 RepID=A0ABQ3MN47_9PSEU|nr:hypothetical protein [Lentzea cavernae]GHH51650.1 hypothetical protein GCM10017774_62470 [Lentzea cavernae]
MHIPAALHEDTKALPRPRSALILPSAILPLLVLTLPFATMGAVFDLHWGWWAGTGAAALAWAVAAGFLARSPKPWMSLVRLLGWMLLWCVEPFIALPLLAVAGEGGEEVAAIAGVLYLGGALWFGIWLFRRYRRTP